MAIEFRCEGCGKWLRVGDEAAGRQARCPACGELSQAPPEGRAGSSGGSAPRWELPAAAALPSQTAAGSPFAATPATAADPDNPYQSPAAIEAWEGHVAYGREYSDCPSAGRAARLAGAILDGLIYLVGMVPGLIMMIVTGEGGNQDAEAVAMLFVVGGMAIVAIVNWVMIAQSGQSIAKRLLGMRIVRVDDGALPGFVRGVILRVWVPGLISQFCSLFGLIDALWIFGAERRCVHDYIAMTRVISDTSGARPARCGHCGNVVRPGAVHCPNCGVPLDGPAVFDVK